MKLTKTAPTKPGYYWAIFAPHCTLEQVSICDTYPVYLGPNSRALEIGYDLDMPSNEFYWGDEITREPIALESPVTMEVCKAVSKAINELPGLSDIVMSLDEFTREPIASDVDRRYSPAKRPSVILLIRVGDFYEAYGEDATILSGMLGMTGEPTVVGFPQDRLWQTVDKLIADYEVDVMEEDGTVENHPSDNQVPAS